MVSYYFPENKIVLVPLLSQSHFNNDILLARMQLVLILISVGMAFVNLQVVKVVSLAKRIAGSRLNVICLDLVSFLNCIPILFCK